MGEPAVSVKALKRSRSGWCGYILTFHSWAVYSFLYLPIVILIIYSFNKARISAVWDGFTLDWYGQMLTNASILRSLKNSLIVGFASTIIATIIGTLAALAMSRYRFFGKRAFDLLLYMPLIVPEIVVGISLAIFYWVIQWVIQFILGLVSTYFNLGPIYFTWGLFSIIFAHVAFNISYVALVVRARLHGYDRTLDEAAMDLGASPLQTFTRITLPLILPGVIAGAMIAFTMSFDDYLITFFVAGVGSTTLPIKVYSMMKFGVTPEVNALSTLILLFTTILLLASQRLRGE